MPRCYHVTKVETNISMVYGASLSIKKSQSAPIGGNYEDSITRRDLSKN
uniref:Uncharacterized protein n=1 Tax=Siphoviridae sp. ctxjx4 TaxID=2826522 RepID=A0A8S5M228_9CAUD|nr:MAG TPA: hypothetical protein [Siphoviridae sp. ctxjx4]